MNAWLSRLVGVIVGTAILLAVYVYAVNPKSNQSFYTAESANLQQVVDRINTIRGYNDKDPLKFSSSLEQIAEARALDMSKRQYFAHVSPDGLSYASYLKDVDLGKYSCENLALEEASDSAVDVVATWTHSKPHRECLLNDKVSSIGVASTKFTTDNQDYILYVAILAD